MILGPIFRAELLRTARRRRYYALRTLQGLLLLFIIWMSYQRMNPDQVTLTIDEAANFARETFESFAVIQLVAILLIIPALFGGSIADEKQRKTLHYLMASQLSGFEIVADKVLGRAPHLAVFLALGLPVVCLLGLIGGVPPEYVMVAYVGTASTATMAVALTVLASTLCRRVRQAVLVAYVVLLAWQFVPFVLLALGRGTVNVLPFAYEWIGPINEWVGATSPLYVYVWPLIRRGVVRRVGLSPWMFQDVAWMVGLQLAASAVLLGMAVWQLRPAFRRHEATQPRRRWFEPRKARAPRPPRWYDRPECGGDAMTWKERYFARTDIFTKLFVLPATVLVSVALVMSVGLDESLIGAFADLWRKGWRGWGSDNNAFVDHLRVTSAWYTAIWLLAVAGASASSIAVEREEDTWVSLTSTPLSGWEILRGKILGAVWAQRGFAAVPLGLWTIGLLVGAVHPLGFLGSVAAFAVVTGMVAIIGVHASLRATSTSKAITATLIRLGVLYGYPIIVLLIVIGRREPWRSYTDVLGLPPRLVVGPLVTYGYFPQVSGMLVGRGWWSPEGVGVAFGVGVMAAYATTAACLTMHCLNQFDRWLDRPTLVTAAPSPRKLAPLSEVETALQS